MLRLKKIDIVIVLTLAITPLLVGWAFFFNGVHQAFLAYLETSPYILFGVGFASWATASRLEDLVGRVFTRERALLAIVGASCAGALTPLCSLMVITFVTGLLRARVPLSAVMAFWISSPLMDPAAFFLTQGILGLEFAILRVGCALTMGVMSGVIILLVEKNFSSFGNPLRKGVAVRGDLTERCQAFIESKKSDFVANIFSSKERRHHFFLGMWEDFILFTKWLLLVFFILYIVKSATDSEKITGFIQANQRFSVPLSAALGGVLYLNGLAAVPLVKALLAQSFPLSAAVTFLIAGGATSLPAMSAVFPIVKLRIFFSYLFCAFFGSLVVGYLIKYLMEGKIVFG